MAASTISTRSFVIQVFSSLCIVLYNATPDARQVLRSRHGLHHICLCIGILPAQVQQRVIRRRLPHTRLEELPTEGRTVRVGVTPREAPARGLTQVGFDT